MNEIMKVLTIIATIFIPLELHRQPLRHELRPVGVALEHAGTGVATTATRSRLRSMAAVAGGLLCYFRRRGWIGGSDADE